MSSRLSKTAAVLLGGFGLFVPAPSTVQAESDPSGSAIKFFRDEQQRLQSHAVPPVQAARPEAELRHGPPPRAAFAPRAARAVPQVAAPPRTAPPSVTVYGDRLGQVLAKGLDDDAGDWLAVTAQTEDDGGLTRPDFVAWLQSLRARLQRTDRPKVAVVLLGSNDRQPLPDGSATVDASSARWQTLYLARIDAVAATFRDAHVPLVWVGLPSVHAEDVAADFVRLNALFRDRASRDGVIFVDSWEAFSDDSGNYSPVGPGVDGRNVKLRKADGFGFTRAGARKLASFVEADVKRLNGQPVDAAPNVADITIEKTRDFDSVLEIDVNAQIRREAGLAPDGKISAGLTQKPAAGPVLALTAPPAAPGGQLATASLRAGDVAQPTDTAQPGRADDFAWPKP